jgi:nucleoside 2-deoxyribosyltransferase
MKKKIYIAAPGFNPHQLEVVANLELMTMIGEFDVFSPFKASAEIFKGRKPSDCTPEERAEVLDGNIRNLYCDLLLAWVGGYEGGFTDPGVIWEMGFAKALQMAPSNTTPFPITLAFINDTDVRQSMNLMLSGTVDAVVKGYAALQEALLLFDEGRYEFLEEHFAPRKVLGEEMEPVS